MGDVTRAIFDIVVVSVVGLVYSGGTGGGQWSVVVRGKD
jgi:hypothetical protein